MKTPTESEKQHAIDFGNFLEGSCEVDENLLLVLHWDDKEIKGIKKIYEKFLELSKIPGFKNN